MFTKNVKWRDQPVEPALRRGRGRPTGQTPQGAAARLSLYKTAIELIAEHGYEATTLRDVANRAGVSVGLLYRYFPNKQSLVFQLYDELSAEYASRAAKMEAGKWRDRFLFALTTSLQVLGPHRDTMATLVPVLVGDAQQGLFAPGTAFSRERVQKVFQQAVVGATDAPAREIAGSLARLLYLMHLTIILWWLLDKSPRQQATNALVELIRQALPASALMLRLRGVRTFVVAGDKLFREALLGEKSADL